MKSVLVTGSKGFIGKNLLEYLKTLDDVTVTGYDLGDARDVLSQGLAEADFVFHLAGVNRPQEESEFATGNLGFTEEVLEFLRRRQHPVPFLMTSSTQAEMDNPYGNSKREAETAVFKWAAETGAEALVYRLPNVFGKWCRPNYNSVVATFCHNIANDLPVQINDPERQLSLVYIDDVVREFVSALNGKANRQSDGFCRVDRVYQMTLQELADKIRSFRDSRESLILSDFADDFTRCLYATYTSYLPEMGFAYALDMKRDQRGWLAEILKSKQFGQIFVSRTKPGITRGNHWHHTKVEKFIVIAGQAVIRFRRIGSDAVIAVPVSGEELKVIDIPVGYTHSIENVGATDLITLFWADEIFDPEQSDTMFLKV